MIAPSKSQQFKWITSFWKSIIFQMNHSPMENLLPRRKDRKVGGMHNCRRSHFVTNYYNVQLSNEVSLVYLYDAKFPDHIPGDSTDVVRRCIQQIRGELRASVGFLSSTGRTIYGSKNMKMSQTFSCNLHDTVIEVQVSKTK